MEESDVFRLGVNFGVKPIPLDECKRKAEGTPISYTNIKT